VKTLAVYAILSTMAAYIAVDIGGTSMRAARFPARSHKQQKLVKIATQHPTESPYDRLVNLIASVWPSNDTVAAIGVAAPGPVDPYKGIVLSAPNIPSWVNLPLASLLQTHFGVPACIGNDANLAALGEWKYGAGKGHRYLVYLTVSTGIGGGVIMDNHLLLGYQGLAAELGHITVERDGPLCGCGQRGHLEALASGPAIARWVEAELSQGAASSLSSVKPVTAKLIAEAARQGDALARRAFARAGEFIGRAIADILHMYNPSIVIIGGGVSLSGDLFLKSLLEEMRLHVMDSHYLDYLTVTTAALGDDTGLLGALVLARDIN
jgi:glucokinase